MSLRSGARPPNALWCILSWKSCLWWHEINAQPLIWVTSGILNWHCTQICKSCMGIADNLIKSRGVGTPRDRRLYVAIKSLSIFHCMRAQTFYISIVWHCSNFYVNCESVIAATGIAKFSVDRNNAVLRSFCSIQLYILELFLLRGQF